jgi:hypothetical protein
MLSIKILLLAENPFAGTRCDDQGCLGHAYRCRLFGQRYRDDAAHWVFRVGRVFMSLFLHSSRLENRRSGLTAERRSQGETTRDSEYNGERIGVDGAAVLICAGDSQIDPSSLLPVPRRSIEEIAPVRIGSEPIRMPAATMRYDQARVWYGKARIDIGVRSKHEVPKLSN